MAITRSQQAKQMLQDGGMLVKLRADGKRPGYATADEGHANDPGFGDNAPGDGEDRGRDLDVQQRGMTKAQYDETKGMRGQNFGGRKSGLERAFGFAKDIFDKTLVGRALGLLGPKDLGIRGGYNMANIAGPVSTEEDDEQGQGDNYIPPTFAQTQAPAGLPAAVMPMQTMDLNRIAYRLMADGGFIDDEPRQAYGLGSIVKKAFKTVRKPFKAVTKTLKKVAKSPTGRLLLAVAAPYALGPAVAQSQFLAGLSAAKKAALISGATTGITQLASGEDLNLKDIAVSAALGGTSAKFFPPGGAPKGIDPSSAASRSRVASDISTRAIPDRAMGQITSQSNLFDEVALTRGKTILPQAKPSIIPDRLMGEIIPKAKPIVDAGTKSTGILKTLSDKITGNKLGNLLLGSKDGGIDPLKSIMLATTLSGLAAKKDYEEDEFSDMDRGEKLDIAAIRRRPFEYMAPRFAGSRFDFYNTAAANGGRIGYQEAGAVLSEKEMKKLSKSPLYKGFKKMYSVDPQMAKDNPAYKGKFDMFKKVYDQKFQKGGKAEPVAKKVMPLLDMGGQEMDLRAEGGFVPIGRMEKADDVPARLSKNEFVFTADAVRNAGEGDVDKGAEVMYNMMKNLESGGDVSEESQGLEGARKMFQTSQRLEEVL